MIATAFLADHADVEIIEKASVIGGVWRQHANAFSRVNSSEPSYRLPVATSQHNTNHSHHSEILADVLRLIEQNSLAERIHLNTEVNRVAPHAGSSGWVLRGQRQGQAFELRSRMTVLCTNRRLGAPRHMLLRGEDRFGGQVFRGLSGDVNALQCAGERVLVLGMGAFAIENMRTSFERRATSVAILCRRTGTVCPQLVDWLNFVRPFDDDFRHDAAGDAVVLSHWHGVYDASGTRRPECWSEGLLKPDGHTVSVSDLFFIAHHARMLETIRGEVSHLEGGVAVTRDGGEISAGIVIKCVGFEVNEGNERLLGRSRMRPTSTVEANLWLQIETHFDKATFNSPFGSSYLNAVSFNAKVMTSCWRDPQLHARLLRDELSPVRINTFSSSEGMDGVNRADPRVTAILREHVQSIASDFNSTMPLASYIEWNTEQWGSLHTMLGARATEAAMPYPFHSLLPTLRDELPTGLMAIGGGASPSAELQRLTNMAPAERLRVLTDLVHEIVCNHAENGVELNPDSPISDAGLDSLAAVELVGQLRVATGVEDLSPMALLGEGATSRSVATTLLELVDGTGAPAPTPHDLADEIACDAAPHDPASASVGLGTAPRPPALSGRVLILLSAHCSGAPLLTNQLRAHTSFAPYELHLLPYATMEERALHLGPHDFEHADPLLLAICELRACAIDEAQLFIDDLGPSCPTWRLYEALLELAHPRVLVDTTPTNTVHINLARRAAQMFEAPCFVHLARHPMACVAEAIASARTPMEAEQLWLHTNALICEHESELGSGGPVLTVQYEKLRRGGIQNLLFQRFAEMWGLASDGGSEQRVNRFKVISPRLVQANRRLLGLPLRHAATSPSVPSNAGTGGGSSGDSSSETEGPTRAISSNANSGTIVHSSDLASSWFSSSDDRPPTASDEPFTQPSGGSSSEQTPSEDDGVELPCIFATPGTSDVVALEDLRRHAAEGDRNASGGRRAPQVRNMHSATKLMARQLGYRMPADLPADCCWMALPPLDVVGPHASRAQPTVLFPGVLGGPGLFEQLVPKLRGARGGVIAIEYSTALMLGCSSWQELIQRYTELVRQLLSDSPAPIRLVAYSFGCRIAYAVASLLEVERIRVQLVLLDGPIGGPRGSFEQALMDLSSAQAAPHAQGVTATPAGDAPADEMAVASQLLTMLSRGGEEPAEPLGRRATVELFIASDDSVGLEMARERLAQVQIHRVRGGHRDILIGRSAADVGMLISRGLSSYNEERQSR